ncbi:hypothetical protein Y032_0958g3214 [Ancylostoma ceylanicum]|uniref:DNA2/NAM7 helicase-like C-terminal domain-containing protein n=1 Tax=Ancylostoma ceylanicum TaxID=53326 RepID=A0A016W9G7_9BILA|nr:hypothetical protein Y032_0958g3214 [Ancylostoma ceylanicum]
MARTLCKVFMARQSSPLRSKEHQRHAPNGKGHPDSTAYGHFLCSPGSQHPAELLHLRQNPSGRDKGGRSPTTDRMVCFPNPEAPSVFVNVKGTSVKPVGHSHHNPAEASICQALVRSVLQQGVESSSIALITFYEEQQNICRTSRKNPASKFQLCTPYKNESTT